MTKNVIRSYMTQEKLRFTVQIGSYSKYICKGHYVSPEFGSDESRNKWSLIVYAQDGTDYQNFIDIHLKRDNYAIIEYVNVKMSIINCFGFNELKAEKEIVFRDGICQVLSVPKEKIRGCFGLKNFLYLPEDTLTIQCDLTVYKDNMSFHENEENFVSNVPRNRSSFVEYFAHSLLEQRADDCFVWEIHNFSVYAYGGRIVSPEYHSLNFSGEWSLVVYNLKDDYLGKSVEIRLRSRESSRQQMMVVKLSVTDESKEERIAEKNVYFADPREMQLLCLAQKDSICSNSISSWLSWMAKVFTEQSHPNDLLTLRCEMIVYEQSDYVFDRKEDFDNSIKTDGFAPVHIIPYLAALCFLQFDILVSFIHFCLTALLIWYIVKGSVALARVLNKIFQYICEIIRKHMPESKENKNRNGNKNGNKNNRRKFGESQKHENKTLFFMLLRLKSYVVNYLKRMLYKRKYSNKPKYHYRNYRNN